MPSDFPDWGGQYNDKQFFPLFDQAELAARLGSLMTYDRRGSVIWQEDFRYGLSRIFTRLDGVGSTVILSAAMSASPPFSAYPYVGAVVDAYAAVLCGVAVPQPPLVGFQASVNPSILDDEIRHFLYHYDGAVKWYANLVINLGANLFQVYVSPGVRVDLASLSTAFGASTVFHHIKLVCDLAAHKLVRGILDDQEFDLSDYDMLSSASVSDPDVEGAVMNFTTTGVACGMFVDNLIVTAAEPPNS